MIFLIKLTFLSNIYRTKINFKKINKIFKKPDDMWHAVNDINIFFFLKGT